MKVYYLFLSLFILSGVSAQKTVYTAALIPENLKENANAVVRLNQIDITITSRKLFITKTLRVLTVLNEYGLKNIDATEYNKVISIEATIFDANGTEIKRIKRKDFKEVAVSEGSIITNNKAVYLDYTPVTYPFTIEYKSEVESNNTAFIPSWYPVNEGFESVEKSLVTINYPPDLGFKYKEYNFENKHIQKTEKPNSISFVAENMAAVKAEEYSPALSTFSPYVLFGLEKFSLEGVEGTATSWENFGSWMYTHLLDGTDELAPETQSKIKALVGQETNPISKARMVYQYVQDKVRYVSIQLGIGGWKPMLAKDVDRLGYGDCKALTNYTRALLQVVGVPSYYTVIYGDDNKRDIDQSFVSMQGNHVILAIPQGDTLHWLECTNQTIPFGFQGDFTDDRMALLVKPQGGALVRTKIFTEEASHQFLKVNCSVDATGFLKARLQIKSKGLQYDQKYFLDRKSKEERDKFYKLIFGNINNLKINATHFKNDKENVEFTEELDVEAINFGSISNNNLIFPLNVFNQGIRVPVRYRTRMNPFEIDKGMTDNDEVTIEIPTGFTVESKPENFELTDKFGIYKVEITINGNQVLYKRHVRLNSGFYPANEYEAYRKFKEQIARYDNSKIVLIKK